MTMAIQVAYNNTCISSQSPQFSSTINLFLLFFFRLVSQSNMEELKKLSLINCSSPSTSDGKPPNSNGGATTLEKAEKPESLKHILKEFNNKRVRVSDEERKKNMKILQELVLDQFITAMKNADPLFKELYKENYYTGSYYEGLKVSDANEFDLNMKLDLPFKAEDVQIVYNNVPPGYAEYKIIKPLEVLLSRHPKWEIFKKLTSIMEGDRLSQKKINEWCQGVGDKALQQNRQKFENITRSRHGPAFTLAIKMENKTLIDVDLVPVIQLKKYPPSVRKVPQLKPDSVAFIVPKPTGNGANQTTTLFRISMPMVEREVIENKGCVKMLIRIFKAIRDNENWKSLASYFIKTVFMREVEKNPTADYWSENRSDLLFIEMLKAFIEALKRKEINHYLFQKYNLISGINDSTIINIRQRLVLYLDKAQSGNLAEFKKLLYKNTP
ncbi:hypothetical protein CHUAL_006161 [Chamberlinius hualienensis]